jgi:hypothetical protein
LIVAEKFSHIKIDYFEPQISSIQLSEKAQLLFKIMFLYKAVDFNIGCAFSCRQAVGSVLLKKTSVSVFHLERIAFKLIGLLLLIQFKIKEAVFSVEIISESFAVVLLSVAQFSAFL